MMKYFQNAQNLGFMAKDSVVISPPGISSLRANFIISSWVIYCFLCLALVF